MKTDIEIAQGAKMKKIIEIGKKVGLTEDELELYGNYKAKISEDAFERLKDKDDGKLILVTAVNPTPAGEGKTTVSIGLADALNITGNNAVLALREPSLGPVFGIKGGAAGGGYAQVVPMEDINLHFTGDMHAITSANNLMCALLDNHIHQGNLLNIDPSRIMVSRCLDINDRALRNVVVAHTGGKNNGVERTDHFCITVASEVMAILCLSEDIFDLKKRLGNMLVAYTFEGSPIYCRDIKADGAMTTLLKDAIKPNLVQTIENTPAIIHGGPFANIAHGCNSIRATKMALKLGDYVVTEAGFGSDLGAEKFLDIKCRIGKLKPSCIVLVATVRSMKYNSDVKKENLKEVDMDALKKGSTNLEAHIDNMKKYGVPVVVAINHFYSDTKEEIDFIKNLCKKKEVEFEVTKCFSEGGKGSLALANKVIKACNQENDFRFIYDNNTSIYQKIDIIAKEIYGADGVNYTNEAKDHIDKFIKLGANKMPVCMAKTPYSLTDNKDILGRPKNFRIKVTSAGLSNGAGFVVLRLGDIMTMPGLSKNPAAYNIDVDKNGKIKGLF